MTYTRKHIFLMPNACEGSFASRPDYLFEGVQTGTRVPGFAGLISADRDASSDYSRTFMKVLDASAHDCVLKEIFLPTFFGFQRQTTSKGYFLRIDQHGFDHAVAPSSDDEAEALSRLYKRIRQYSYNVNGLQFLGELREAIHMIRHPAEALWGGVDKYTKTLKLTRSQIRRRLHPRKSETARALRIRRANATKNAMSGSWLELQFGLRPLISDVRDIAVAALELSEERFQKTRFTGSSEPKRGYQLLVAENGSAPGGLNNVRTYSTYEQRSLSNVKYVAGFKRQVTSDGLAPLRSLSETFGFQVQNFVPTAWELLPWSFLIDYFVNIGAVLEAATTDTSGLVYVNKVSFQRSLREVRTKFDIVSYGNYDWNKEAIVGKNDDFRRFEHTTFTRAKLASIPLPPLVVSVPGIDSSKWTNMAALLAQMKNFRF